MRNARAALIALCSALLFLSAQFFAGTDAAALCTADDTLTAPGSKSGNTCGAGNDCAGEPSQEHVYEVRIPVGGVWFFDLCGSAYDTVASLGTAPGLDDLGWNDDGWCGLQSLLFVPDLSPGTYYVTIEGYCEGTCDCGFYSLEVFSPGLSCSLPSDCDDGDACTDDDCENEQCMHRCNATAYSDPCCGEPVCSQEAACTPPPACRDSDLDGYGSPGDLACRNGAAEDCNDSNDLVFPGATESCDGIDNQCPGDTGHGEIDEGCSSSCAASAEASAADSGPVRNASGAGTHLVCLFLLVAGACGLSRVLRSAN
jgi:hypothetical protein